MLNDALGRRLSPFRRGLDGLLINTTEAEGIAGLSGVLERYPPAQVWWGTVTPQHRAGERLVDLLKDQQAPEHVLAKGETLAMGEDVRLEMLTVTEQGSALLLSWGNFRALIPSGVPPDKLEEANLAGLSVLVLEPRDLSETKIEEWLSQAPLAVVATVEDPQLQPAHPNWLVTRKQGWYAIISDGNKMWVEKSR